MRGTHRWVVVVVASTRALGGCGIDSLAGSARRQRTPLRRPSPVNSLVRSPGGSWRTQAWPGGRRRGQGDTARAAALSGTALDLAKASATLSPPSGSTDALSRPDEPRVLAISAGHTYPRAILATSADSDGRQHLAVLTTNEITTPYLLENTVTMLPGATLLRSVTLPRGATLVAPKTAPIWC